MSASLLRPSLFSRYTQHALRSSRAYSAPSTPPPPKVPIKLIAELRALHPISMTKAKEALANSSLDVPAALKWLQADLEAGGAAKAKKLAGRQASDGLIAVGVMGEGWGRRGGIVELNCETSFVARTEGFTDLLRSVHHSAIFYHNPIDSPQSHLITVPVTNMADAPLISPSPPHAEDGSLTTSQKITSLLTTTGEKIELRRLAVFAPPTSQAHEGLYYPAFFAHTPSGVPPNLGSVAAFVVLHLTGEGAKDLSPEKSKALLAETEVLGRALARQMVGVSCRHIYSFKGGDGLEGSVEGSDVLMEQHFMFFSGEEGGQDKSVGEVLKSWGDKRGVNVRVDGGERWVVGEGGEEVVEEEA